MLHILGPNPFRAKSAETSALGRWTLRPDDCWQFLAHNHRIYRNYKLPLAGDDHRVRALREVLRESGVDILGWHSYWIRFELRRFSLGLEMIQYSFDDRRIFDRSNDIHGHANAASAGCATVTKSSGSNTLGPQSILMNHSGSGSAGRAASACLKSWDSSTISSCTATICSNSSFAQRQSCSRRKLSQVVKFQSIRSSGFSGVVIVF